MVYLSKSKYCGLWQCPKIAWLRKYKPETSRLDDSVLARMEAGNEVGALARSLYGDFVDITAYTGENPDLKKMMENTRREMEKGTPVICEASFEYNGLYCAVDILRKDGDGWAIYEVKSSSKHGGDSDDKPVYIADIAYQKYVLENCGVKVSAVYLVCLNGDYVFDGTLDIHKLFTVSDVAEAVAVEWEKIETNLLVAERLLLSPNEPKIDLFAGCKKPYLCSFWKYCSRHLPQPSVFDLYRMQFSKKIKFYRQGIISYEDLLSCPAITNDKQLRQIEFALQDKGTYIEKENIRFFLGSLSYPLYFLDFETMQPVIPKFVGTKPYAQIPFQYSLHYGEPAAFAAFWHECSDDRRFPPCRGPGRGASSGHRRASRRHFPAWHRGTHTPPPPPRRPPLSNSCDKYSSPAPRNHRKAIGGRSECRFRQCRQTYGGSLQQG